MQDFLHKIQLFISKLDEETSRALEKISVSKIYKKGDFLLQQGEISTRTFVIEKGSARKYYLNDGKEITTGLFFENDITLSLESYVFQKPSKEYIQLLEDSTVTVINDKDFLNLKDKFPKIHDLDIIYTELYAVWLEERLFQFYTLDATSRYRLLLEKNPHIIQKIPLTYIASYLGISLETLSRIRAKI